MDKFFANVQKPKQHPTSEHETTDSEGRKALPKGVVLGKDGKPCRSCTDIASWRAMMRKEKDPSTPSSSSSSSSFTTTAASSPPSFTATTLPSQPPDCPPDVATLGHHTWTFLHTLSASYPPRATPTQQSEMTQFLTLFSKLYPCWHCAEDFQQWMRKEGNRPRVEGREGLGRWMCEAHNEVNRKLGKREFECGRWEERWRVGWGDGRCD